MTDFNPFASPSDEDVAPAVDEGSTGPDKRVLVGVGGLLAALVAGGAFLLLGGEGESDDFSVPVRAAGAGGGEPAAPEASPAAELPQATSIQLGRSPFDVRYIQPAAAPAEPEPSDDAAPADPAPPVTGGGVVLVPGGTTAPPPATGGTDAPPAAPAAKEYKLVLLRVFGEGGDQSASFSIDGKEQVAKVGSTFGPTAEILLIGLTEGPDAGMWTATLQVGDDAPFDVKIGEPAFVR